MWWLGHGLFAGPMMSRNWSRLVPLGTNAGAVWWNKNFQNLPGAPQAKFLDLKRENQPKSIDFSDVCLLGTERGGVRQPEERPEGSRA